MKKLKQVIWFIVCFIFVSVLLGVLIACPFKSEEEFNNGNNVLGYIWLISGFVSLIIIGYANIKSEHRVEY